MCLEFVWKKFASFFSPPFWFWLLRSLRWPSGVIKEHFIAWRGILCCWDIAGHWSNVKDKKLGSVIEFWELELDQVDESRGGLKGGNGSVQKDSYTAVLPGKRLGWLGSGCWVKCLSRTWTERYYSFLCLSCSWIPAYTHTHTPSKVFIMESTKVSAFCFPSS